MKPVCGHISYPETVNWGLCIVNIKYSLVDIYLDILLIWYILLNIVHKYQQEDIMDTAKIFINGRSQAIRLPKAYRFEGKEVYIKKTESGVLLISKDNSAWNVWEKNLNKYDKPFMTDRNQPKIQQERADLDEIFD